MTDKPLNLSGIILAGGGSTRMGSDKALLDYGDGPVVQSLIGQLEPICGEVLVVSSRHREGRFGGVRIVRDEQDGMGPLMGILSGLEAASNDLCFVVGCDIPKVDMNSLMRLYNAAQKTDIAVISVKDGQIEPLHAVYRRSVREQARKLLNAGERRARALIESRHTKVVTLPVSDRLANINTREEYRHYLETQS